MPSWEKDMDFEAARKEIRGPAALAMVHFNDDFSLDLGALEDNISWMIDGGLGTGRGFVISPSGTGELLHLTKSEHQLVVKATVRAADGKLPVVAGVASTNLHEAIDLTRTAQDAGAQHVMLAPPFYYRLDDDSFLAWVTAVSEAVPDIALMLYDQPWRAGLATNLNLPLIERMADIPNVVSLKYGSPATFVAMITAIPNFKDRFAFIDNSLGFTSTVGHIHGGSGFIAGPAGWWPEFELEYWDLLEAGHYAEADRFHARLAPYMYYFMGEEFTDGEDYPYHFGSSLIKASLEFVGLKGGVVRPPFQALGDAAKKELFRIMEDIPYEGRRAG